MDKTQENVRIRNFEAGEVIFRERENSGGVMYVVLSGSAAAFVDYGGPKEKRLALFLEGDVIGEKALFLGKKRAYTAIAGPGCAALEVDPDNVYGFISSHPEKVFTILENMCQHLHDNGVATLAAYPDEEPEEQEHPSPAPQPAPPPPPAPAEQSPAPEPPPQQQQYAPPQQQYAQPQQQYAPQQYAPPPPQYAQPQYAPAPPPQYAHPQYAPPPPQQQAAPYAKPPGAGQPKKSQAAPQAPAAASQRPQQTPQRAVAPAQGKPAAPAKILFPEGHGEYDLHLADQRAEFLYEKSYTCPACARIFKATTVKVSKLYSLGTDWDLRVRYRGIEPMLYDVVVCPVCLYSALGEAFSEKTDELPSTVTRAMASFKGSVNLKLGEDRDTQTVFASYYLAIECVKVSFKKPLLTLGKLWLKLMRLYDDVGDANMYGIAMNNALNFYLDAYQGSAIPQKQIQQLSYILGVLSAKAGNKNDALKFLFTAKTEKPGNDVLRRQAEDRIEEIKAEQQQQ